MELEELYDYKNRLMKDICSDADVIQLVTGNANAAVPNRKMPYTQVFPYEYIPDTVDDGKTYICFDVDVTGTPNDTTYSLVLYVWVLMHKSAMHPKTGGCAIDNIIIAINKLLNGSRYYGLGELKLEHVRRFKPALDYHGRALTYSTRDFNMRPIKQNLPSNRKEGV